jgi:DNA-binding transcriptional LysR family regulator
MNDLNEIRIFAQVVIRGSFTAAADFLGMTKSTVSRKISALEARLGVRLLVRTTRQIHLTEQGEALFQRSKRILSDLEEAELAVSSTQDKVTGHLNIIVPIEMGQLVMGSVIGQYLQQYPDVTIHAELSNRKVDMVAEGIDLIFQLGRGKDSSLISRCVSTTSAALVASPAYVETHGRPESVSQLEQHNCIVGKMATWTFFRDGLEHTIKPFGSFVTNNITCIREAVISGLGISRLPLFLVKPAIDSGELIPLLSHWQSADSQIFALYPSRQYMPRNLRAFLDFSADRLANVWDELPV